MFYIKISETPIDIATITVYTTCPKCGIEHAVDIVEFAQCSEDFSLEDSHVYCEMCSGSLHDHRGDCIVPFPPTTC